MNENELEELLNMFAFCGAKYKNDADFRQKIDANTVDLKKEFGLDIDKEVEFKANSDDVVYFIIPENQVIMNDNQLSNIVAAKNGQYANMRYEDARVSIAALGIFAAVNLFAGIGLAVYITDIHADHPEYFKEGTLVFKSTAEYYGFK